MDSKAMVLLTGGPEDASARRGTVLAAAGFAVVRAADFRDASERNARDKPKLLVIEAPPHEAAAAIGALALDNPDAFILQIGAEEDGSAGAEVAEGADAFLLEPVDPRELLALVRSLLRLQQVEANLHDSERRLELAQESAGFAILDWNMQANTFIHSAIFATLFDLPEGADAAISPEDLVARIHPEDISVMGAAVATSQAARSFDHEFRIIRRDGSVRWIASRGRFLLGPSGRVERMISLSFDITARKEAERTNAQLASLVASSIDGIVSVDPANLVTTWNVGAERLFGFTAEEMIGHTLDRVLVYGSEDDGDHRRSLTQGETCVFETTQKTRDAQTIEISINSAPMLEVGGKVIGASLIMRDNAPQKRREDHVRFLMRELTHRSKNLLAVIQAMARQSLNKGLAPDEFVRRFSDRLSGLAGSHDLLSSVHFRGASIVNLIRSQLRHYEDLFEIRIFLQGADIMIRPEAAQNIGIALHELSTNAAKYGALSTGEGQVAITWAIDESSAPPRLRMTWQERNGPPVVAPTRRGFGHVVMNRVAGQALDGKSSMLFAPEGVVWTLDVPAASVLSA